MIKMDVYSTRAAIRSQEPLTVGLVGARVHITFDEQWKPLGKIAVFRQGDITRDAAVLSDTVTIPWEVLQQPGLPLEIGVYGTDAAGKQVIPTVWASTCPVRPAPAPVEDPGLEATPEVWQQVLASQGSLDALETENRTDLVSAINETNRTAVNAAKKATALRFTVLENEDGTARIVENYTLRDLIAAHEAGKVLQCYWYSKDILARLFDFQPKGPFIFIAVSRGKEYRVEISDSGVECSVTELSRSPEKLTFTGAVEAEYDGSQPLEVDIPRTLWVTVTANGDGSFQADRTHAELLAAHNAGQTVYCKYGSVQFSLLSADADDCIFNNVHMYNSTSGMYYKVKISADGSVSLSLTKLEGASGSTGGLSITDDGEGNVTVTSTGAVSITDDGEGNVTIG